jgi:tryptophan-rich sensory protein
MKERVNWKVLIACFVIVYFVAGIGSIFTTKAVSSDWYQTIKPSITPPNYVFPVVWNILFLLITFSLYIVWINSNKKKKTKIAWVFGINFILNIFWSFLYFYLKNPKFAFFELILLWFSILSMIIISWEINKKSAYLLIPYLIWVSFAGILNYLSAF